MSVQRAEVHWARYLDGNRRVVLEADHARIVAEAGAAVFAFHPEWTVTGMCDPDCLACRRLTELITERSAGYEEGRADAEQAHAAALAAARAEGFESAHNEWAKALPEHLRVDRLLRAPRTLTADDPEPGVGAVVLLAVGNEAVQRSALGWQGYAMHTMQWAEMFRFGPVTLIHDGEDR